MITPVIPEFRQARTEQGLTLSDVSARTGIAVPNLSRIERGETDPRWSTINRLAQALDLSITLHRRRKTSVVDIQNRMAEGAERLKAAGRGQRDAQARLKWKAARGVDTSVEQSLVARR